MAAYRNKFAHKNEVMRFRQDQYYEQVMSPSMHKDFQINHFINQREEQLKKDQEVKAKAE